MLIALLIAYQLVAATQAAMKTFLVSSYPPVTNCSSEHPLDPAYFNGFEIDVIRDAMSKINYTEGTDFQFNCTTWDDIFEVIEESPRTEVIGAVSGITISKDRMERGLRFSQPTISTGLSLIFRKETKGSFYLRIFDGPFLIALICIPIIFGSLLYIYEDKKVSVINYIYHTLEQYFKVDDFVHLNFESKVLEIPMRLFVIVVVALYIAGTTNLLFLDKNFGGVTDSEHVVGLPIASFSYYQNTIMSVGGKYQHLKTFGPQKTSSGKSMKSMRCSLHRMDLWLLMLLNLNAIFMRTLTNFVKFDFGVMMPRNVSDDDALALNVGLEMAFTSMTQLQRWRNFFDANVQNGCPNKEALGLSVVTFKDFEELWQFWRFCSGCLHCNFSHKSVSKCNP